MQLIAADIPSNCDLVLMGDDHEGSKLKHQLGVEKCLDFVMAERYRRLIHMGDAMEAVQIDDKRYMENTQDDAHPRNQEDAVKKQYKRVSKRTVTRLLGNHCLKLWRHGNYVEKICAEHGIPYGGYACNITFSDKHGLMFKGHFRHGIRGTLTSNAKDDGQRIANLKASFKMKMQDFAGDCVLMAAGCTHRLLVIPPVKKLYITDDGLELKQHYLKAGTNEDYIEPDRRWFINTGTLRKGLGIGFIDYAELGGYPPLPLGYAVVEIRDRKIANVREVEV